MIVIILMETTTNQTHKWLISGPIEYASNRHDGAAGRGAIYDHLSLTMTSTGYSRFYEATAQSESPTTALRLVATFIFIVAELRNCQHANNARSPTSTPRYACSQDGLCFRVR
jgi:hypothetical protein